jgi:23S rRNA pseudouridine1911/1915/1917 synthase
MGGILMLISDYNVEILYEDNHLVFAKKPFGIIVQKDETNDIDMLTIIKDYLKNKYNKPGNVYLGLLHRLDRPAGGLMVFAKTSKSAARLSEQFRDRTVNKSYFVVAQGILKQKEGFLQNHLVKNHQKNYVSVNENDDSAKLAKLSYKVNDEKQGLSLIDVKLHTGRFHQIRVQFANLGHPLYGDVKYGGKENKFFCGIALWSYSISISHPITKNILNMSIDLPELEPWKFFVR